MIPPLNEGQESTLAAVCAKYLSESRYALREDAGLSPAALEEIMRRRAVCTVVTGGAE